MTSLMKLADKSVIESLSRNGFSMDVIHAEGVDQQKTNDPDKVISAINSCDERLSMSIYEDDKCCGTIYWVEGEIYDHTDNEFCNQLILDSD